MHPYHEISAVDVGKLTLSAFGRRWRVCDFIGRILPRDVGKRVYRMVDNSGGYFLQVENDQQREKRINGA